MINKNKLPKIKRRLIRLNQKKRKDLKISKNKNYLKDDYLTMLLILLILNIKIVNSN